MKNILVFVCTSLMTSVVSFLTWWLSLGYYQAAEHWLVDVYAAKDHQAGSIGQPKIIVASGSNALFGLDSQILEEMTGMPVANLASHAGLPLDFILSRALAHAKPGDVVVAPLEFAFYNESRSLTKWQVTNMESWGHAHLRRDVLTTINFFKHASLADSVARLWSRQPIPKTPLPQILEATNANSESIISDWAGYSFKSMNSRGDILVEDTGKLFADNTAYTDGVVSKYSLELLRDYSEKFRQKGATLLLTWPTTVKNPEFDLTNDAHLRRVREMQETLSNSGLTVVCRPEDFHFARSEFLDTAYHLNYRGAVYRTVRLGECLNGHTHEASEADVYLDRKKTISRRKILLDEQRAISGESRRKLTVSHLRELQRALGEYKAANGSYPVSDKWDGLFSLYGTSSPNWIKGLAPKYISELPRDPRMTESGSEQYIYMSDGIDFKVISHGQSECELFRKSVPELVDPARDCSAIGVWSTGARNW